MKTRVNQKKRQEIQETGDPAKETGGGKPQENKMPTLQRAQTTTCSDQNRPNKGRRAAGRREGSRRRGVVFH